MIFGIGTDIVSIARMHDALERHGERLAARMLSNSELDEFHRSHHQANYLAKRFAAKEAAAKALGTGFRDGLALRHIEVGHEPLGRPLLRFHGKALALIDELGVGESFLSISDEREHAVAFVTLMRR